MPRGKRKADGEASANGIGHNGPTKVELTDEQRQALFFQHKRGYQNALAKKKEQDAAFKNACKQARAELGRDVIKSIKLAIDLESEGGDEVLRAEIERQLEVARWMNLPFGQQAELFTDVTDPRPATERAFSEGKKAGMEGRPNKPPHAPDVPQYKEWIRGWQEGQAAIFKIGKTPPPGATAPIGETKATHTVA